MNNKTINRFSPLKLRAKQRLRNRIVVPPMASQTASPAGFVTTATETHYRGLGEAQAGLLIVEYTYVHSSGRSEENQLGIDQDAHLPGLRNLARIIQKTGALAGIQITHSGGKTERALTGGLLMGASAIPVPVKDRAMEIPTPMTMADIAAWKRAFIAAADRAATAGFDLLELHAAHGYGLNQWLSPLTNQRQDAYGIDLRGRMRLLLEIVQAVRDRHPTLLISVRIPGQDFQPGGLTVADTVSLALALEKSGVDLLHVSSGIGGWRRPMERVGEGYLVAEAETIQAALRIPVIGVGGIESAAYIDAALASRHFAMAAVGRAILKNPRQWQQQNLCKAGAWAS